MSLDTVTVHVVDLQRERELDPTERALHAVFDIESVFKQAIRGATCPSRCAQLRERLKVAATVFTALQDVAAERHDVITKGL